MSKFTGPLYITQYAKGLAVSSCSSTSYNSVAVDKLGNIYTVGGASGGTYDFGNGVSIGGKDNMLVKYNSNGSAQWAKSVVGPFSTYFNSVAVDDTGNVYVVGSIEVCRSATCDFGNGVTISVDDVNCKFKDNIVLVKYDSNGNAQWAKIVINGSISQSSFNSVIVDANGNIYAAGYISGNGTYDFGDGVTVAGQYSGGNNVVLVKYNTNGNAQWAKSISGGSNASCFNSVAVDSNGNIYAGGIINGTNTLDFGNSVTVAANTSANINFVLVKYDSNGNAQWARSATSGSNNSSFSSVAVDGSGNVYAGGSITGATTYGFGNNISAAGQSSGANLMLVKYDSNGSAQWAKSVSGTGTSSFNSIAVDSAGNTYAVGYTAKGKYNFGNSISIDTSGIGYGMMISNPINVTVVKYDNNGNTQWAKSAVNVGCNGASATNFASVAIGNNGNVYAVGNLGGPVA